MPMRAPTERRRWSPGGVRALPVGQHDRFDAADDAVGGRQPVVQVAQVAIETSVDQGNRSAFDECIEVHALVPNSQMPSATSRGVRGVAKRFLSRTFMTLGLLDSYLVSVGDGESLVDMARVVDLVDHGHGIVLD